MKTEKDTYYSQQDERATNYLLGRKYPFFMSNGVELSEKFYVYSVYSPGVDENLNPYVSLTKISEKSEFNLSGKGKDTDIISTIMYPKKVENFVEYATDLMKREGYAFDKPDTTTDFPKLKTEGNSNYCVKSMIVNLRNNLRYSNYRLYPGKKVDILWGPDTFVVCKIVEDENSIWLEPENMYKNVDAAMIHPLEHKLTAEDINIKVDKSQPKIPATLLYSIKSLEKMSFDRRKR